MTELATPVAEEATIRQLVPFNELFGQQFHEALKCCELVTIPPRKKLFKRGQREPYDYYLLSGSVDLVDGEFNITSLRQGDPECRHALDNRPPHRYSAITTDTCELLKVDRQRLELAMTWGQAGDYSVLDAAEDDEPATYRDYSGRQRCSLCKLLRTDLLKPAERPISCQACLTGSRHPKGRTPPGCLRSRR